MGQVMSWPPIAPSLQPRAEIDVATFEDYAHVLAEGGTHFPDLGVKPAGGAEAGRTR